MTCHSCRWSCGFCGKDKRSILICLHPSVTEQKEADKVCRDYQREPGADEPEDVMADNGTELTGAL